MSNINGRTAGTHVTNIFAMLGVNSRATAVALAFNHGLIVPALTVGFRLSRQKRRVHTFLHWAIG